ncbi:MAG: hypothetical protein ACTSRU_21490, partial [Candidatus Hodarchaeales archaeon]
MAASVSLQIKSNFDEAEKEFQSFSQTAFKETEKVKKALGKIEAKQLDAVIDKHQRLATAVTATRGKQEAFIVQQRNLRNEIEKQIRMGLDPQDERLKKIRAEYTRVTEKVEENRAATKKQKEALKLQSKALKDQEDQVKKNKIAQEQMNAVLQRSYMAILAGVGLATAALAKNTFEVAKNGDEYAKQGNILGVTAEEYQELAFAADRSGVEMGTLTSAIAGMNRRIGEARNGTGALVTALKDSNPELLEQLKSAKGTSEAFDIMTTAMATTTDVQDRAALSSAAF